MVPMPHVDRRERNQHPSVMRDQSLQVSIPSGNLEVVVTGEALEVLRDSGNPFQDGVSLVRHYRSFIAEIAMEKFHESGARSHSVVICASDVSD
jgi:hypothetical protein